MPARTKEEQEAFDRIKKRMRSETRGYRLQAMREQYDQLSRAMVAERIGVSELVIDRIERGDVDDLALGTIRDYVEALGGEVEVLAKFGDERIVIA
jgi:predicted transcriptional regulator